MHSRFTGFGADFFSGFGLGTILMPALALFFPVPIAIAATAVVHFANNLFKLALVGRMANKSVLLRFAIPAVIAALIGASRSMFLIKAGLNKDEFIGTGVVTAVMVNMARLLVYGVSFFAVHFSTVSDIQGLILAVTLSAFAGALLGRELLKKITLRAVQVVIGVMLIFLGVILSVGLI